MYKRQREPSADPDDSKVQSILSALAGYVTAQIADADQMCIRDRLCALNPKGKGIQRFASIWNTEMYPSVRRRCTNKKQSTWHFSQKKF